MKTTLMLAALVLALCGAQAHATAIGAGGGKKSVSRSLDQNGNPLQINDDKPWKVFESAYTTVPAQVVDEAGVAPVQGLVKRICLESSSAAIPASETAILWDTSVAANMTAAGTGRRIMPPLPRATGVVTCVEINAMFTSGLGVMNSATTGSTYVYWRELGGYR